MRAAIRRGDPDGEYLTAFSMRWRRTRRTSLRSRRTARHVLRHLYFDGAVTEHGLCFFECKIEDFADALETRLHMNAGGIELRHLDGLADEAVEACALLVDDGVHFGALRLGHLRLTDEGGRRGADGGEGRPQFMGHGIQQRGVKALAFTGGFHVAGALEGLGAFESDGNEASDRLIDIA